MRRAPNLRTYASTTLRSWNLIGTVVFATLLIMVFIESRELRKSLSQIRRSIGWAGST